MISYLPLAHIAEQVFSIHGHITAGYELYFAESIDKVPENLKEAEADLVLRSAAIWEKFHAGITDKLAKAPPARRRMAEAAMSAGMAFHTARNEGQTPGVLTRLAYALADRVVLSEVQRRGGLSSRALLRERGRPHHALRARVLLGPRARRG